MQRKCCSGPKTKLPAFLLYLEPSLVAQRKKLKSRGPNQYREGSIFPRMALNIVACRISHLRLHSLFHYCWCFQIESYILEVSWQNLGHISLSDSTIQIHDNYCSQTVWRNVNIMYVHLCTSRKYWTHLYWASLVVKCKVFKVHQTCSFINTHFLIHHTTVT